MINDLKRENAVRIYLTLKGDGVETRTTETTLAVVPEDIANKIEAEFVELYTKTFINDGWEVNSARRMAYYGINRETVVILK